MKIPLILAAMPSLALAVPAAAQTMDHSNMPGMKMPATPAPARIKPKAKPAPRPAAKPVRPTPHAGHALPVQTPRAAQAPASDPACPPEHAAMGHCTPAVPAAGEAGPPAADDMSAMPGMSAPAPATETGGTALPAGNAPAPAAPEPNYADRVWGRDAMVPTRAALRRAHGGGTFSQIMFNLAEVQIHDGRDGYRWDGEGWFGGDINRLVVKTEGEGSFGDRIGDAEVQALYSRAISPYFNLQAGVRQDIRPTPSRSYAALGIEGLAPYWFKVEAHAFLSTKGDLLGRLTGSYDQRITQRVILQPRAELNLAAQDVRETGIGAGLSDVELGLRLRYEVAREFAPYVGVSYQSKVGRTADLARAIGDKPSSTSLVVGVRTWF